MKRTEERYSIKRYRAAYGSATLSITLVLFLLGTLFFFAKQANEWTDYLLNNIGLQLELSDRATDTEIAALLEDLNQLEFTSRTKFISKEEAATNLAHELGEDFIAFIGYNPLPNTVELFLHGTFTHPDSIVRVKNQLHDIPAIEKINYQETLLAQINRNIRRTGTGIVIFSAVLLLISLLLIHNTIRLAVYARRLSIKSMLLVGATQWFIRRPFFISGLLQGAIGGMVASGLLWSAVAFLDQKFSDLNLIHDQQFMWILSAAIVAFGVVVTAISNLIAIKKYLKINSEELY